MPFDRFLILYIDNDRNAIIKNIHSIEYVDNKRIVLCNTIPNQLHLIQASENILAQYFDAAGGVDNLPYILQLVAIAKLQSRIERIKAISASLRNAKSEELIKALKKLGIYSLETADDGIKRFEAQLATLQKELNRPKKGTAPTYEMFDKILAEIDPKLTAEEITTERFCTLYNKLKTKAKAADKAHGGR